MGGNYLHKHLLGAYGWMGKDVYPVRLWFHFRAVIIYDEITNFHLYIRIDSTHSMGACIYSRQSMCHTQRIFCSTCCEHMLC